MARVIKKTVHTIELTYDELVNIRVALHSVADNPSRWNEEYIQDCSKLVAELND